MPESDTGKIEREKLRKKNVEIFAQKDMHSTLTRGGDEKMTANSTRQNTKWGALNAKES